MYLLPVPKSLQMQEGVFCLNLHTQIVLDWELPELGRTGARQLKEDLARYCGLTADVLSALRANPNVEKGEYCAVIECPKAQEDAAAAVSGEKTPEEMLLSFLLSGMEIRDAVQACADAGVAKNAAKKARLAIEKLAERLCEE